MPDTSTGAVILKIGAADLSAYCECQNVSINTSPVFGEGFVNVLGKNVREVIGNQIQLSASFGLLPQKVALDLRNACSAKSVTVEYKDPAHVSAVFERPSFSRNVDVEIGEDKQLWNCSVSMTCPLLRDDGL